MISYYKFKHEQQGRLLHDTLPQLQRYHYTNICCAGTVQDVGRHSSRGMSIETYLSVSYYIGTVVIDVRNMYSPHAVPVLHNCASIWCMALEPMQ